LKKLIGFKSVNLAVLLLATNLCYATVYNINASGAISPPFPGFPNNVLSIGVNDTLNIAGNLNMPPATAGIVSRGTVNINGRITMISAGYQNIGAHNSTITNQNIFDSFNVAGAIIDLSRATISVNGGFVGVVGVPYSWVILNGSTVYIPNSNPKNIIIAGKSFLNRWEANIVDVNRVILITYYRYQFDANNQVFAGVFDQMVLNPANARQVTMQTALNTLSTGNFNKEIRKFLPNINATVPSIVTQNAIFSKAEVRLAALRNNRGKKSGSYMAGDINSSSSMWVGAFGSLAKQHAKPQNFGFRAKTAGVIIGLDSKVKRKDFIGGAFGVSNSNVEEASNAKHVTRVMGYHALIYGTKSMRKRMFIDWLASVATNRNESFRPIYINNFNLNSSANYNGYLGSVKLNFGKSFCYEDLLLLSPIFSTQYTYLRQPSYDEFGGAAALHVEGNTNKSIATLGLGGRINFPEEYWRFFGSKELRAMITYDVINSRQVTYANFIAGSPTFVLTNPSSRLAFNLGADFGIEIGDHFELNFSYDYEVRYKYVDNTGMVKLRYIF
jgi:outer membrane autotransporter protein